MKHIFTLSFTSCMCMCIDSNAKTFFIIIITIIILCLEIYFISNYFYDYHICINYLLFISHSLTPMYIKSKIRQFRISSQFEAYKSFCYLPNIHTQTYTHTLYSIYELVSIILFLPCFYQAQQQQTKKTKPHTILRLSYI